MTDQHLHINRITKIALKATLCGKNWKKNTPDWLWQEFCETLQHQNHTLENQNLFVVYN